MYQPLTQHYSLHGHTIAITCNNQHWMEHADGFLSLPCVNSGNQILDLVLQDIPSQEIDVRLPLPDPHYKVSEFTLLLNESIPVITYIHGQQRWQDYIGYGRSWSDRSTGVARVFRYDNNSILPNYATILFVYNMINYLLGRVGFFEVHASCVEVEGSGVLITGNSGRGKSTSVCALLRHGCPVLSDERILLHREAKGFCGSSISDLIKVRAEAMQRFFPDLTAAKAVFDMDEEYFFKCGSICENGWLPKTSINHLLVINRTGKKESRVFPINPSRVVGELFPVTLKPYETAENLKEKFDFLMDFLQAVPCYQLDFGTDMKAFTETIFNMVRGQNR